MEEQRINITQPFLPPKEEYQKYIDEIWQRNWLTNDGPLVKELETKLKKYLDTTNLLYVSNGTIALQLAMKALNLSDEIITTPFSYVATTAAIVWEECTPVFVDIDKDTLNIDASKIEDAITSKTTAILATHVYGNPCDIDAIEQIAKKHHLKVIYDAAHCFGTKYKGKSVFEYGDISTASFHATKVFHTIEGGAVFTKDKNVLKKLRYLRNFGHDGPEKYKGIGINGKNSEFHAAMGLCNLKYIGAILKKRKKDYMLYANLVEQSNISLLALTPNSTFNYSYFPIIFESEEVLLTVIKALNKNNIFPRRYFYPLLSELDYVENTKQCKIAQSVSNRVLCLPLFYEITEDTIVKICDIITKTGI